MKAISPLSFSWLLLLFFGACSSNEEHTEELQQQTIQFGTATSDFTATKGSQATLSSIKVYSVSCAYYPSDQSYASAACGSYWFDLAIQASTGYTGYYWPGKKYKLSFYAYYPYGHSTITLNSKPSDLGIPIYDYLMPNSSVDQPDFMTCDVLDHMGTSTTPIALAFSHRLTNIRFSVYNQSEGDLIINHVRLHNIRSEGSFHDGSWNVNDVTATASTMLDVSIAEEETKDVTLENNQFFIIPQTVRAGTEFIEVNTNEGGENKTYLFTPSEDMQFDMGKSYLLKLIIGNGRISLAPSIGIEDMEQEILGSFSSIPIEDPQSEELGNNNHIQIGDWQTE